MKPKIKNHSKLIKFIISISFFMIINGCSSSENNHENNNTTTIEKFSLWSGETKLRGANIFQRKVYPELDGGEFMGSGYIGPPFIQEDFNKLASMGANYVNISHPGIFCENQPYKMDEKALNNLKELIEMIGKADMFVVISFRTGPGRSEFTFYWGEDDEWFDKSYYNDMVWKEEAAQIAWAKMWKETVKIFKDNPYVVGYDLMVEPNSNDVWLDIWEPDDFYSQYKNTLYDWNSLFPQIINIIREEDNSTPILVGGMAYSAVNWFQYIIPVQDSKTVYTIHQYEPYIYTHQKSDDNYTYPGDFDADYDGKTDHVDRNWLQKLLNRADNFRTSKNIIIACNEYGVARWAKEAYKFLDDQMNIFEEMGMNYAIWEWSTSWEPFASEVNDFNFCFGPDPNNRSYIPSNNLIDTIKKYWTKNTFRPSNVNFSN